MNNNTSPAKNLEKLRALDQERMHLSRAAAVLQWDQETYLPPSGVEERALQLAVLEGLAHEKLISPEIGELLDKLAGSPVLTNAVKNPSESSGFSYEDEFPAEDFLRVLRRDYERAVKLPPDFVRECARSEGLSQAAWAKAREKNDFGLFAPHLEKMIDFAKKKAEYWGWEKDRLYDGLLDFHEPGIGVNELTGIFGSMKERLHDLLEKIAAKPVPANAFLYQYYDKSRQDSFCREVLKSLGFDSSRGRLDLSVHPFTTTLGFNDVRITTRYAPSDPLSGLFSVIHETGHAFYEMGIGSALRYSCLSEGASMGIHESQSRLWENVIGRSRAFWKPWFPGFRELFSDELGETDFEGFYRALNTILPGPIRVEADEVSYSLHIILRFELEKLLLSGKLTVSELPSFWKAAMKDYLGVECADDAQGVLQDVHWSMGAFGYFPSYALGNLYALQFWDKLTADLGNTDEALERKEYGAIHSWLKEKIYRKGRSAEPALLIKQVTGRSLSADCFFRYIENKYGELYGL